MVVKTTRITVETETLIIIRRTRTALAWCPDCRAEVETINVSESLAEPAAAAQLKEWLDTGKLHMWQPVDGPAQICLISLLHCFEPEEVRTISRWSENPQDHSRR